MERIGGDLWTSAATDGRRSATGRRLTVLEPARGTLLGRTASDTTEPISKMSA